MEAARPRTICHGSPSGPPSADFLLHRAPKRDARHRSWRRSVELLTNKFARRRVQRARNADIYERPKTVPAGERRFYRRDLPRRHGCLHVTRVMKIVKTTSKRRR
ncbi:hypothetical protein LSAT2_000263 [Lamellibrachia satsuma]|nr:hypothetical protein LSAT2_000263 [Lamellibrachia satsuma]